MDNVDDTGPNVELDEIDVELDDGTVGPTLPTGMTLLEGRFDDVGLMLLPLVEGTLSDDKGDIEINELLLFLSVPSSH